MTETKPPELPQGGPTLWVTNYADYLYSYVCTRIDDNELARDLVQETFLAALEGWEKFDRRSSEKTWLTAILKNKVYDVYRKKSNNAEKLTITINDADTGKNGQIDHPIPVQIDHLFRLKLTTQFRSKLTT